jgi:hypothetical protein
LAIGHPHGGDFAGAQRVILVSQGKIRLRR